MRASTLLLIVVAISLISCAGVTDRIADKQLERAGTDWAKIRANVEVFNWTSDLSKGGIDYACRTHLSRKFGTTFSPGDQRRPSTHALPAVLPTTQAHLPQHAWRYGVDSTGATTYYLGAHGTTNGTWLRFAGGKWVRVVSVKQPARQVKQPIQYDCSGGFCRPVRGTR